MSQSNPYESSTQNSADDPSPLPFVLPLILHLIIGSFLTPDVAGSYEADGFEGGIVPPVTQETWTYLGMLGLQIVSAIGILFYFKKTILSQFPFRISPLSIAIGVIGFFLWIAVCYPQIEGRLLESLGFDLSRPAFNPFLIGDTTVRLLFFAVRFSVLCLVVPIIEELLVRGWLVRTVESPDWSRVNLKNLSVPALLAASVYGVVAHPMEAVAAFLWFGLVTWLMRRTGNLWDCVATHAVTNFLLGVYVLYYAAWHLW